MDIRQIKGPVPEARVGYLESIWELQKELLKGYIGKIEKDLPMYPIDIHSFEGQQVLKDFSARIIEETAEGYESTTLALELFHKNGYDSEMMSGDDFMMLLNHLQNSNEEQADAMAFYISLFLYANVDIEDIFSYVQSRLSKTTHNTLQGLMDLGWSMHNSSGYVYPEKNLFPLITVKGLKLHGQDPKHVFSYIPGFTRISSEAHELEDHMLWTVAYHINIGRNFLKNKPWKQTQELTDVTRYDEQIILGFIAYLGYLKAMGFTAESLYTLCYKKNRVNHFRQESHY